MNDLPFLKLKKHFGMKTLHFILFYFSENSTILETLMTTSFKSCLVSSVFFSFGAAEACVSE